MNCIDRLQAGLDNEFAGLLGVCSGGLEQLKVDHREQRQALQVFLDALFPWEEECLSAAVAGLTGTTPLEQLAEMKASLCVVDQLTYINVPTPPDFHHWPAEQRQAWMKAMEVAPSRTGEADDLARMIGEAHANWQAAATTEGFHG